MSVTLYYRIPGTGKPLSGEFQKVMEANDFFCDQGFTLDSTHLEILKIIVLIGEHELKKDAEKLIDIIAKYGTVELYVSY